jgi:hypothetical protein
MGDLGTTTRSTTTPFPPPQPVILDGAGKPQFSQNPDRRLVTLLLGSRHRIRQDLLLLFRIALVWSHANTTFFRVRVSVISSATTARKRFTSLISHASCNLFSAAIGLCFKNRPYTPQLCAKINPATSQEIRLRYFFWKHP